jgi:hypothetical protein
MAASIGRPVASAVAPAAVTPARSRSVICRAAEVTAGRAEAAMRRVNMVDGLLDGRQRCDSANSYGSSEN